MYQIGTGHVLISLSPGGLKGLVPSGADALTDDGPSIGQIGDLVDVPNQEWIRTSLLASGSSEPPPKVQISDCSTYQLRSGYILLLNFSISATNRVNSAGPIRKVTNELSSLDDRHAAIRSDWIAASFRLTSPPPGIP